MRTFKFKSLFTSKRRVLAVMVVLACFALVPLAHSLAEWGPDRPTFDWNDPSHYPTYITFNSFTNNPTAGDERTFLTAYEVGTTNARNNVTVTDNEELVLRTFFHNNARSDLNLVAHNTRVRITLPASAATDETAVSYISADNATPQNVWDSVHFNGARPFTLEYKQNSAALWNGVFRGKALSNSIVTDRGSWIGFKAIDGEVPGCSEFSGWVTIVVRVHMEQPPKPVFKCDALNVTVGTGRKVDANVAYTASGGATFKSTTFSWGDGNQNTVKSTSGSHTYARDSNYTIDATLTFDVGGTDKSTDKTPSCSKNITISTPTPPQTPAAPAPLPNTGAGSTLGIFTGVSALAGLGHYFRRGRQTNN